MSIEAIQALTALTNTAAPAAPMRADAAPQLDFGRMLGEGISKVDSGLQAADVQLRAMAAGKDARHAVGIACRFDINSRLPVHSLELKRR